MNPQDSLVHDLWVRIRAELLTDKKKSAVMGTLVAVALVLGLKMSLSGNSPRKAAAAESATAAAGGSTASDSASVAPAGGAAGSEVAAYLEQIDSTVPRDLFAADFGQYPMAQIKPVEPSSVRSGTDDAAILERERRRAFVATLAEKLKLQSTMPGDPPTAIINGYVVRPGQQFMGFVIREISLGSCIVAHDTIEVTLTME